MKSAAALAVVCLLAAPLVAHATPEVLGIPSVTQTYPEWCWAASSMCILNYHGQSLSQCQIVEWARKQNPDELGDYDCCGIIGLFTCDKAYYLWGVPGSVEEIMHHWGLGAVVHASPLSLMAVQAEIDADRPFAIRWGWANGGGHIIVGHGVDGSTVYYMNPWYGEGFGMGDYDWMVQGTGTIISDPGYLIHGSHTWTDSLTTGPCLNKADGGSCDDHRGCTDNDTCVSGVCQGSSVVCQPSDVCHLAGTCDPAVGACNQPLAPDGTICDDGNACTRADTCQNGHCVGADPVPCIAGACDVSASCDQATGQCSHQYQANGSICDDGNPCTRVDTCQNDRCVGADPLPCTPDPCQLSAACDPSTGKCAGVAKPDGISCDDGNACTQHDVCRSGVCTGIDPVVCSPQDTCQASSTCDPTSGSCVVVAAPDLTACPGGTCKNGSCVSTSGCGCRLGGGGLAAWASVIVLAAFARRRGRCGRKRIS